MVKAPCLNEFISTETILQLLNSSVKTVPAVVECPWEPDDRLYLLPDGHGIYGHTNDFYGDVIEIFKKTFNIKSTEQALKKLEENGVIADVKLIPPDSIADYEIDRAKRTAFDRFLNKQKEDTKDLRVKLDILSTLNAMPDNYLRWYAGFGRHVAFTPKYNLERVLGTKLGIRNSNVMMLPYYDMPNRVATLRCVYTKTSSYECVDRNIGRAGGLFMADTVPHNTPLALALGDPFFALRLQRLHANMSDSPLPIAVYNEDTKAWPIWAQRVIFWDNDYNVGMFKQARKLSNSSVSVPTATINHEELLKSGTSAWLAAVTQEAKPWVIALKDYLLSLDTEKAEAVLRSLELTSDEHAHLLYECDKDEKTVIRGMLDTGYMVKTAYLGDQKVIERDGVWHAVSRKGRLSRISNITFEIHESVDYKDGGMFFIGELTYKGSVTRFMAPIKEFTSNPASWLRYYMLEQGLGVLQVPRSWERRLLDIAFAMTNTEIEHRVVTAYVGWTPDWNRFVFPNLTLIDGYIDEGGAKLPSDGMPCVEVDERTLRKPQVRALLEDTDVNRYFWALFALSVQGFTAKYLNSSVKDVVLTGNMFIYEVFADAMGLCTVQTNGMNSAGVKKALKDLKLHDVPAMLLLDTGVKELIHWRSSGTPHNLMISASKIDAQLLASSTSLCLTTKPLKHKVAHLTGVHNLYALYVKDLQRNRADLIGGDGFTTAIDLMANWIEDRIEDVDVTVIREAPLLIRHGSITGTTNDKNMLLHTIFSLMNAGTIKAGNVGPKLPKNAVVLLDTDYVRVMRTFESHLPSGFNLYKFVDKTTGLVECATDELLISRKVWDAELAKFNSAQIT